MFRKGFILAIIASALATGAGAAHLGDVQGVVLVNGKPVSASVEVAQGDRIKVVLGSATLVYANGAAVQIAPGHTLVVLSNPPERVSMKDGGSDLQDAALGAAVFAGGVGLAVALAGTGEPASP